MSEPVRRASASSAGSRGEQVDERDGWAIQADALAAVLASEDAREGPRAFVEKRAPNWTGR